MDLALGIHCSLLPCREYSIPSWSHLLSLFFYLEDDGEKVGQSDCNIKKSRKIVVSRWPKNHIKNESVYMARI